MREGDVRARDLTERVNAGIRAPGSMNSDRRAFELRQRLFEQPLYRIPFSLPLPADESRAVVREGYFEVAHVLTTKVTKFSKVTKASCFRVLRDRRELRGYVRDPGLTTGFPSAHRGHFPSS